ncbi:hypothetical protein HHI36_007667 [Cryptolaemus montrouzieri]|uniref:Uncharacterized protein n=1 Tax=Cryptolaemus montrouzieri TaxID=559131 RepID=A0ABD2MQE8_9CUCU
MPSILSTIIDPIPSTSSTTILLRSTAGVLNSNIESVLPLPVKRIPERLRRKGRTKQYAKMLTLSPIQESSFERANKKAATRKNLMPKCSKKHKPEKNVATKAKRRVLQNQNTSSESDISFKQILDEVE